MTANRPDNPEILISEELIQKLGWALCGLSVLFILIGLVISPRDDQGKPILYLPEVKAVEDYRKKAQSWHSDLTVLDGEISTLIDSDQGDLFSQSRAGQTTFQHAVKISRELDQVQSPPIAAGFHEKLLALSLSYLKTARTALQWISSPEQELLDKTAEQLEISRRLNSELEQNKWLIPH